MEWHLGQPIVAIHNSYDKQIKKNSDYTIQGLSTMPCCGAVVINVGVQPIAEDSSKPSTHLLCRCGKYIPISTVPAQALGYGENHFAPLDVDISELTKQLEEPIELAQ